MKPVAGVLVLFGVLDVIAAQDQRRTIINPDGTAEFIQTKDVRRVRLAFTTKRFSTERTQSREQRTALPSMDACRSVRIAVCRG